MSLLNYPFWWSRFWFCYVGNSCWLIINVPIQNSLFLLFFLMNDLCVFWGWIWKFCFVLGLFVGVKFSMEILFAWKIFYPYMTWPRNGLLLLLFFGKMLLLTFGWCSWNCLMKFRGLLIEPFYVLCAFVTLQLFVVSKKFYLYKLCVCYLSCFMILDKDNGKVWRFMNDVVSVVLVLMMR